jgi:hypothetical protein
LHVSDRTCLPQRAPRAHLRDSSPCLTPIYDEERTTDTD